MVGRARSKRPSALPPSIDRVETAVRAILRLFLGPLAVAMFAGIQLWRYGMFAAAGGAYLVFVVAQVAIVFWGRYQLRMARRRLATRRRLGRRLH